MKITKRLHNISLVEDKIGYQLVANRGGRRHEGISGDDIANQCAKELLLLNNNQFCIWYFPKNLQGYATFSVATRHGGITRYLLMSLAKKSCDVSKG